jgi:hypothetical protein
MGRGSGGGRSRSVRWIKGRRERGRLSWLKRLAPGGQHGDEVLAARVRLCVQAGRQVSPKDGHTSIRTLASVAIRDLSDEIAAELPELGGTSVVRDTAHRGARESDEC